MAFLGDLFVKIGLSGLPEFTTSMNGVSGALSKAVSDADKSARGFDKMGSSLTSLGTTLTAAITLPIAGVGIAATKMASDFDAGMRKVASITELSGDEFKKLSGDVLALAKSMGIDAVKATEALYLAVGSGIPKENALEFIRVASVAAIAGFTDAKVAVDAFTTIIAAYNLSASDAKAISDTMFEAMKVGKIEFADLAKAIGPAAQQASNLGISYEELLAATATLSLTSGGVSQAVTQIESAMTALVKQTPEMERGLEQIGFKSAQAAIASLGFEGALQALRETTHGSAEAFQAMFGRTEGFGAALGVTGQKVEVATGHFEQMKHAQDGVGASMKAMNIVNEGTKRQFDALINNLQTTAIELGVSLLPAVNQLLNASKPFVQFLADAAKWFGNLSAPVKETAILFAAALAAVGPLTVGLGLVFSAVGSLISGFGALSGALGALGVGLSTLGIVVVAGLGIAALVTNVGDAKTAFENLRESVSGLLPETLSLSEVFDTSRAALGLYSEAANKAGESSKFLAGWWKQTKEQFTDFDWKSSILGPLGYVDEAIQKLADSINLLRGRFPQMDKAVQDTAKSVNEMSLASMKLSDSALIAAGSAAGLRGKLTDQDAAMIAAGKSAGNLRTQHDKVSAGIKANTADLRDGIVELSAHDSAVKILKDSLAKYEAELREVKKSHDAGIASAEAVARAEQKVHDVLEALTPAIDRQTFSWEGLELAADGVSVVLTSLPPDLDAIRDAAQAVTIDLDKLSRGLGDLELPPFVPDPSETEDALDKQVGAHQTAGTKVQGIWERTTQQVSTIISDMGKSFADGIFNLFDNSENNKLDEQAADIRSALEDVTAEYTKHVADVSGELEAIPAAYSDALDTLKGVTDKKLGSLDKEYAKSIKKIQEQFEKITKQAKEELDDQLKDLDEQLSDKRRGYERSTEDAQDSYERDTDNLKESLSDKERDYRQWVEGQQLKLRQLEGDNSSSAQRQRDAIQLELQHRAEDMEDTRQDIAEALAREEADLKQSLTRKKQDWELEQAEIKQRHIDAQGAFQATLTEAEGDLEASILERKTTYEEDKTNAIATYEESKAEIIKKFGEQTAALEAELTKSKGAYDTYKTDIEAKLKEIEDAHKGPLERIGELFKGVFTSAGEALLRFAGEQVMGALFKQFDKLLDMIPGIGSALGGIFGPAANAAGNIATPPISTTSGIPGVGAGGSAGGAGSGVGGALGSISAVTGIVTGIVSAVTDVMGVFRQMQMDTALNKIEQHTAVIALAIAGIAAPWETAASDSQNLLSAIRTGGNASKGMEDAFSGWYRTAIDGIWDATWDGRVAAQNIDKNLGYLYDFHSQSMFDMQVKLGDIRTNTTPMAQTAGPAGGVTVNIMGNFYGNEEAVRQIKQALDSEYRLQGGFA